MKKNNDPWLCGRETRRSGACTILFLSLLFSCAAATSDEGREEGNQWRLCPQQRHIPARPEYSETSTDPGSIEIRSDTSRITESGLSQFSGEVEIIKGEQSLSAELAKYDHNSGLFHAEGRAHLWNPSIAWSGESIAYDSGTGISELVAGHYWLLNGQGRGRAGQVNHDGGADLTTLSEVDYSTCPLSDEVWRLTAKKLTLDHKADRGSATHAVLRVKDVPVLYFPYINFPTSSKRKSGFLAPTAGTTEESGVDVRIPYYWNIAPQHDATLTPRHLEKRGEMLDAEYRYLGQSFAGRARAEYLPSDDLRNNEDRHLFYLEHDQKFLDDRALFVVNFSDVSDKSYLEDFGSGIGATSQSFLDQKAEIQFLDYGTSGGMNYLRARVQGYEVTNSEITDNDKPYSILPQVYYLNATPFGNGFTLTTKTQSTYFDHSSLVKGGRIMIEPAVEYSFVTPFARLVPKLAFHQTEYFLDDPSGTYEDHASRTAARFSLDGHLYFERQLSLLGTTFLQTLEPRLYYLLIPNVGQDDIPVFDSDVFNPGFNTLFRDNRFSGGDRLGDANQVTFGLTSSILDPMDGRELSRFNFGQVYYFRDRKVTLPGEEQNTDGVSELIADATINLNAAWSLRGALQWDPNEGRTEKSTAALRFNPDERTVFNFGYHFRRTKTDDIQSNVEQTDVSFRVPLNDAFAAVGSWNYSLIDSRSLETLAGIEYASCCWGLRVVGRRFLRNTEGDFDKGVFIQFHLRGLGGIGQSADSLLRRGIRGYEDPFD
jgi:LPS-assembly protein